MKKTLLILLALAALLMLSAAAYLLLSERYADEPEPTATPEAVMVTLPPAHTDAPAAPESAVPNKPADQTADFTVTDADGGDVKLSDHFGKPIVVNMWATWCGYCVQELPDFESAYQTYGDEVDFMMVDAGENNATVEAFIAKNGYTFPVYYDLQGDAAVAYQVQGIPVTLFIDADGVLVKKQIGMLDAATLQKNIDKIIGR